MCGIVGYVGPRPAVDILLPGLARLEYRGYDSAGLALLDGGGIEVVKEVGRISALRDTVEQSSPAVTRCGMGHTRWATHGAPSQRNAHPHLDCAGTVAVVHNGIIENWAELKAELVERGHVFRSQTDTEVVSHLLEEMADLSLADAVRKMMQRAEGAMAVVAARRGEADHLVGARRGSPLVVGLGEGENFFASDIPAFLEHTRRMAVIADDRVVELTAQGIVITDLDGNVVEPEVREIEWDMEAAEKGGYPTFMLKEIHEQPTSITDTLRGRLAGNRVDLSAELAIADDMLRQIDKVFVVACGTSFHAAMLAKYAIERWTRLPVEIDIASEFRYRDPVVDRRTLVIGISQSGETLDTLAAVRHGREQGAVILAVSNVLDSSLVREADGVLYTRSGPEIGVAASKTFTAQLVVMQLFGLHFAQVLGSLAEAELGEIVTALRRLPAQVTEVLAKAGEIGEIAARYIGCRDFFFLGRSGDFPVAMEGALKLKEIAYVRAEGYAAGEMKHGPIALVEPGVVVVGVATDEKVRAKTLSNMEEMRARGGSLLMVVEEGVATTEGDDVITVPAAPDLVCSVTAVVPLQMLAYQIATAAGLDVDKPRNLAKTVTVE